MRRKFIHYFSIVSALMIFGLQFSCGTSGRKSEGNSDEQKQQVMVFAAASLTDVMAEIIDSFEVSHNVKVKLNLASSGTLARQIEQGGAPDVFISASKRWADYVDSLGVVIPGYKTEVAQNELVLVAPQSSHLKAVTINRSLNLGSLLGSGRLSIGDPSHVPAGRYAKQALEYYGWYDQLKKKMLPAKDVRSALMIVEMGEAPIGIVYRTDALKSGKVKILDAFPEKSHQPIVYVAEVCANRKLAKDFYAYLNSGSTKPIWDKYGFKQ